MPVLVGICVLCMHVTCVHLTHTHTHTHTHHSRPQISANVSGANVRVPMSQILLGTTAASSSSNSNSISSGGGGGSSSSSNAAGGAHVAPSSPSKRRKARKEEAALQPADKEEGKDTGKDTWGSTRKDEAALQPTDMGGNAGGVGADACGMAGEQHLLER
jgi:hypothetical protein